MTDKSAGETEPRIIVDDDWKQQVQKEKEQLASQSPAAHQDSESAGFKMPAASFPLLITTLSTQALAAMGFVPDPATGKATVDRPMAKHFVDTLGVLEEKTRGNLTDDESHLLIETLHQLRMAYVAGKGSNDQSSSAATVPPKSSIELA